jgi:hypothetical protein
VSYPEWQVNGPPSLPPSTTENTLQQAGIVWWPEDTGTFQMKCGHPPYVQRGTTIRFRFSVQHVKDGAIGTPSQPFTQALAAAILDRYRQPALTGYFTLGTVSADPNNSNAFYVDVAISASVELEYFEIKWTATYTPVGSSTALPIQQVHGFRITQPAKPSKHYFYATNQFGQR